MTEPDNRPERRIFDQKDTKLALGCLALIAFLMALAAFSVLVLVKGWP